MAMDTDDVWPASTLCIHRAGRTIQKCMNYAKTNKHSTSVKKQFILISSLLVKESLEALLSPRAT